MAFVTIIFWDPSVLASLDSIIVHGCKHSKVDQESAPVYESHDFLGQTPISSSNMLFKKYIYIHDDLYC